jgi:hypothetical protein
MQTKYKLEHNFSYGWDDSAWLDDGETPLLYNTKEEAQEDIRELIAASVEAAEKGDLPEPYNLEDYRVVPVE